MPPRAGPLACARCARIARSVRTRPVSTSRPQPTPCPSSETDASKDRPTATEQGALSRRLEAATEEALLSRSGRRAIEEAGFDPDLKARLLSRISAAPTTPTTPTSPGPHVDLGAGSGVRHHAASEPWTGTETTPDAVLRMLDDAKPRLPRDLRGPPVAPPALRRRAGGAERAAGARERAESYREIGLSERERGQVAREYAEKFGPGVRSMPSLAGLASMADAKIEEAMARGQFKNIPRGPGQVDTRPTNPFIDTTEYLMNNMIKRQDLVPPWIEKQQDLVRAAGHLRSTLRTSWSRHVADAIASRGGTPSEHVALAEAYARAEATLPRGKSVGEASVSSSRTDDAVFRAPGPEEPQATAGSAEARPFRDPAWEARQQKHIASSIERLNSMTRSYNLMAPDLAKKAYFSAEAEMRACFREGAPLVAAELRRRGERAPEGPSLFGSFGAVGRGGVVHERAGGEYGLKEFWRDLWRK